MFRYQTLQLICIIRIITDIKKPLQNLDKLSLIHYLPYQTKIGKLGKWKKVSALLIGLLNNIAYAYL